MSGLRQGQEEECSSLSIGVLPDALLGRVFGLLGKQERQVALVSRRWNRLYWSEPSLWDSFEGTCDEELAEAHPEEFIQRLLAVAQRVGRLASDVYLAGLGDRLKEMRQLGLDWSIAALLCCLDPRRIRSLWLSAVPHGPICWGSSRVYADWGSPLCETESLPAAALRRVGALRALASLCLASWQLPACTPTVLARLTRLQLLQLRTREVSPACMAAVLSLTGLCSLYLSTAKEIPEVQQLTRLSQLASLVLHQRNPTGGPLIPPFGLPHLTHYAFAHDRGPVVTPGGVVDAVACTASQLGGAKLVLSFNIFCPWTDSLDRLLEGLLPAGAALCELQVSMLRADSAAALAGCSHLSSLRVLQLDGLHCRDDTAAAALAALLSQATGLYSLHIDKVYGEPEYAQPLAEYGAAGKLFMLQLSHSELRDLPAGRHYLSSLLHLDLSCNNLVCVPPELAAATGLASLLLCGNEELALDGPSVEVLLALPKLSLVDLRGVRLWPANLLALGRRAPRLHIRADSEEDQWVDSMPHLADSLILAVEEAVLNEVP